MRTGFVFALAAVGVAFVVPGAAAQTPSGDSVTGHATSCDLFDPDLGCFFSTDFDFDARSGPSGEGATGSARWSRRVSQLFLSFGGPVSCLAVNGNTAIIGSLEIAGSNAATTVFRVVDGGAGAGQDSIEAATAFVFGGSLPSPNCSQFPPSFPTNFLISGDNDGGDIVVHDAQPLPNTKDQCKNGGWRHFPGFKNQGDCVSFVATGGKNPPAGH
jgi:hypothetical protein